MANPFLFLLTDGTGTDNVVGRKKTAFDTMQQDGVAPDLITFTPFNPKSPSQAQVQLVDVVHDFPWTQTPAMGRHEVPFIRMSEYRVEFNSLMQNIKYQLQAFTETLGDIRQGKSGSLIGKAADAGATVMHAVATSSVGKAAAEGVGAKVSTGTYKEGENKGKLDPSKSRITFEAENIDSHLPPYLRAYHGLYGVQPTGFEYYLPYFNTEWKSIKSKWGETEGGGMGEFFTDLFSKEGTISTFLNTSIMDQNTLGAYIERPQMYQYGGDGPGLNFSLTLTNTNDEDDIIRNWHLMFMLAYQNLPNKTSKVFLEPPVIYEIEIPGQTYFPYAYIESVQIVNRGATRVLKIPYYNMSSETEAAAVDSEKHLFRTADRWDAYSSDKAARAIMKKGLWRQIVSAQKTEERRGLRLIEAIIPDAYEIQFNIKSLLPESKNLLFHSTLGSGTLGRGLYTASIKTREDKG